jgi:sugar transferase (PEP-CTERM system associated)
MLRIFRHYISGLTAILLAGDLVVIGASFMVTLATATWGGNGPDALRFALVAGTTIFLLYLGDLYNVRLPLGHRELLARLVACQGLAGLLVAAIGFALPSLRLGRWAFFEISVTTTVGLLFWRWSWLGPKSLARMTVRVLVVGTGPIAKVLAELAPISARPFSILGFIDDDPAASDLIPEGHALLGKTTDLSAIVEELHPDLIVVAQMDRRGHFPAQPLLECRLRGIAVEDWPAFYEKATGKILVTSLRPSWLVFADGFVKTPRTEIIKRLFDVTLAFCGLILAAPVMLLVAVAIKLESPGSVLYRQPRSGQNGCVFILNKFRSMRQDAEKETGPVWATQSDSRVTRVGAFLRRTRLDELPQLFNVLVGHMSFIGPRPERPEFVQDLQKQIPFYMKRLSVKPGITGWAQVKYRYGSSVDDALEKLQYDLYYIKNLSLFLDFLILLNTVQVVLFARGR